MNVVQGLQLDMQARSRISSMYYRCERNKKPSRLVNGHTKKMMEGLEVLHQGILSEGCNDAAKKSVRQDSEYNVINTEE